MATLEEMTNSWKIAVGSDSGLGEYAIKYDFRGEGFIHIDRHGVTNEDKPADLVFSGKIDTISGIVGGTVNAATALMKGKLKISPMGMAMKLQNEIQALLDRMPKASDAGIAPAEDASGSEVDDHPLPPRSEDMRLFAKDMLVPETPDSYGPLADAPGLLVRRMAPVEKYSDGRMLSRMLRADPSIAFQPKAEPDQVPHLKAGYVSKGWARYDIEGLGDVRLEGGTFWCLPPKNRHRLLEVSPDFEIFECEYTYLTSLAGREVQSSAATAEMIQPETADSFQPIPNFLAAIQREFPILKTLTAGAAGTLMLRANPPHIWRGSPWHLHHNDLLASYLTKGGGMFDFEGIERVELKAGDFWFQQPNMRHREVLMSDDFEVFAFDAPGAYSTTMLIYDAEEGAYKATTFEDATDSADLMDVG